MKRVGIFCLTLALLLSCLSCGKEVQTRTFFLMDTGITVTLYTQDMARAEEIFAACRELLGRFDALWSPTNPESDVSKWNSTDSGELELDARTLVLLQTALEVSEKTDGAFDITVAPLVALWSDCETRDSLPTDAEMQAVRALIGREHLSLTDKALIKSLPEVRIDLGGIGKGAAIDALIDYLDTCGIGGGLVSFGSNVAVFGKKPDGNAFRIALRDPKNAEGRVGTLTLNPDEVLSVSGDYERYVTVDGKRYHHLLDPQNGYPAENGLASVAVIAADGALADALSTALFIMGRDRAMSFYESGTYAFEAVLIAHDGEITVTKGFEARFFKEN